MSIATPPSSATTLQPGLTAEPSWEVVKLFPSQGNWSENEYLALADTNRLVELSEGNIKVIDLPTASHQDILDFVHDSLKAFVKPAGLGKVSFAGLPVKLRPGQFREPDVLFMLAEHSDRRHEKYWDGADLVMEVVSEDRAHDLETKRSEYAQAGIPEYWIIDPKLQELTVLKLVGTGYQPAAVCHRGDQAASVLLPGFAVDVAAVFDAK
jgi:Uma2 family endonuclease